MSEQAAKNKGFDEPVLRCDACNKIVLKGIITTLGMCNHCGNKRFRPVDVISEGELVQVKKIDGSEAFLELFEDKDAILAAKRSLIFKEVFLDGGHNEK